MKQSAPRRAGCPENACVFLPAESPLSRIFLHTTINFIKILLYRRNRCSDFFPLHSCVKNLCSVLNFADVHNCRAQYHTCPQYVLGTFCVALFLSAFVSGFKEFVDSISGFDSLSNSNRRPTKRRQAFSDRGVGNRR